MRRRAVALGGMLLSAAPAACDSPPEPRVPVALPERADEEPAVDPAKLQALARVRGPDVVRLPPHTPVPAVPAGLRGLTVRLADRLVGARPAGESLEVARAGCAHNAEGLLAALGWVKVEDPAQPSDLVMRVACTASVQVVTVDGGMFLLLPRSRGGMRLETPAGALVEQLEPIAETLACPEVDAVACGVAAKEFGLAHLVGQLARSTSLAAFAASHGPPAVAAAASPASLPALPGPEPLVPDAAPAAPPARATLSYVEWPEPDRRPPVYHGAHVTVGGVLGLGSPEGFAGGAIGYEPTGALGFELGGGTGGAFGPAVAEMMRAGVPLLGSYRLGLGAGLSQNFFLRGSAADRAVPAVAHFLDLELFHELRFRSGLSIRLSQGVGLLLNPRDYAGLCTTATDAAGNRTGPAPPPGCSSATDGVPASPWTAAGGGVTAILYGRAEVLWAFDR